VDGWKRARGSYIHEAYCKRAGRGLEDQTSDDDVSSLMPNFSIDVDGQTSLMADPLGGPYIKEDIQIYY
jgi:hypothetical protein